MKRSLTAIFAIALLGLSVFARGDEANTLWKLTELNGKSVTDSKAYIEFNDWEMSVTGNAGCNRMFGKYTLKNGVFDLTGVGSTKMACANPIAMKAESDLLKALDDATRIKVLRGVLSIYAKGKVVARFANSGQTTGHANAGLAAQKWKLVGIGGKQVELSTDAPFLNFDGGKMSAGGNTGCNVFGGSYELKGTAIKFGQMISTMRACEFEDRMTTERSFLDALQNADRFRIGKNMLFIYKGDEQLLSFVAETK